MEVKGNKLFLGGISAEELISKHGSPLYVYEEDKIRPLFDPCIFNLKLNPLYTNQTINY